MTNTRLIIFVLGLSLSGGFVSAQETSSETKSTLKVEDVNPGKNKVDGNIDEEITNAKLRAESGSKSKFSLSFTGSYNGSSLEKPFDKDRPNITNDPIAPRVYMGGSFGGRYRMDKNQSLSLGIGYSVQRPFQEAKYGDVSNPYLSYSYVGKLGGVQNVADASLSVTTNNDQLDAGSIGSVGVSNTMMYDFGGSRASVGLAVEGSYEFFGKDKDTVVTLKNQPPRRAGNYQDDYSFAAYPLVEYALSDSIQLRTVFRPWIFSHNVDDEGFTLYKRPWTQSFGIGFAAARDIYLYPNFQWNWERWRGNDFNFASRDVRATSTVGLSATLNIF